MDGGWIGVDLDGTLAHFDGWRGFAHIGEPVPLMAARVKQWLAEGKEVRIITARVCPPQSGYFVDQVHLQNMQTAFAAIAEWTKFHFGRDIRACCMKDMQMIELWDDRAVQVELNTGKRVDGKD